MELAKIEKLLERYEDGKTSLAEENLLREYFLNENVPEHLRSYQLIFMFSANQKKETMQSNPGIKSHKNRRKWYSWTSIAAILIVALGVFFFNDSSRMLNDNDLGTISDEELALEKTKETLNMVSQLMNEGTANLAYLKEFNKTTNKILKTD
ncbi:hypothetical protein [Gramella sp. KN1008]|uniref:hypothetical protein n=1 Tax=Gramella sp. KN1008 TaxID=2529298 RepID=UPI00103A8B22|nr:hypothetical protein [Gramella sp. KN1008]TBW29008.1 hypothetical protein EZJ28_03745 [Gramella sp. KN1008]